MCCVQWEDESSNQRQTVGAANARTGQQQDEHVHNAQEVG